EIVVRHQDLASFVPQLVYHQDEPLADWTAVPMHYVSKLARENGTIVVQVGEGSDELFHGYRSYLSHARFRSRYWPALQLLPLPLRRTLARAALGVALRSGRGVAHAQALEEAAEGRLPFWGGAIAYQGALRRCAASSPARSSTGRSRGSSRRSRNGSAVNSGNRPAARSARRRSRSAASSTTTQSTGSGMRTARVAATGLSSSGTSTT